MKRINDTWRCPHCLEWILRRHRNRHLAQCAQTVKRPDLFGNVHDTMQTETELNGVRPTQGRML